MESHKAILIESSPRFKCCVFSIEYGPICVSSCDDQLGMINVDSISLLHINQLELVSSFSMSSDPSNMKHHVYEELLFAEHSDAGNSVSYLDRHQRQFIKEVALIKGLRERLIDSSRISADENSELSEANASNLKFPTSTVQERKNFLGCTGRSLDLITKRKIVEFINKSEAVIGELLSAHNQFMQQQKQNIFINSIQEKETALGFSGEYFEGLYYQLQQVQNLLDSAPGHGHFLELNDKMTKVSVHFFDGKGREHNLVGELSPNFPSDAPTWTCDLPIDFVPDWKIVTRAFDERNASFSGGLYNCVTSFIELISSYQLLWNELEDLDTNTWVIDPPLPARLSCTNRRIMLMQGLSAIISLEPENPRAIPLSMRLIGTGSEIERFRTQYEMYTKSTSYPQKHAHFLESTRNLWCERQSIRSNLETCFKISLPKSETANEETDKIECAICYSYSLSRHDQHQHGKESDETPKIKCSNRSCARDYHRSCLTEWMRSLPGSKASFGRIFGSCPYCYETISVLID